MGALAATLLPASVLGNSYNANLTINIAWLPTFTHKTEITPRNVEERIDNLLLNFSAKGRYLAHDDFRFSVWFSVLGVSKKRIITTTQRRTGTSVHYYVQDDSAPNGLGQLLMRGEHPLVITPLPNGYDIALSLKDLEKRNRNYVLAGTWEDNKLDVTWTRHKRTRKKELARITGEFIPE